MTRLPLPYLSSVEQMNYTSIFLAGKLGQTGLMGPIAVLHIPIWHLCRSFSHLSWELFTTKKERAIKMQNLRPVSKLEKILFPIVVTVVVCVLLPTTAPLVGMLMLGNLFRESGVVRQLQETASNTYVHCRYLTGAPLLVQLQCRSFLKCKHLKDRCIRSCCIYGWYYCRSLFGKLLWSNAAARCAAAATSRAAVGLAMSCVEAQH